jgi:hypothetical protein
MYLYLLVSKKLHEYIHYKNICWTVVTEMFKNKSLMFDNWINSDLIYINNILNKMGKSSQNLILDQLKYNINCISEFIYLKSNT